LPVCFRFASHRRPPGGPQFASAGRNWIAAKRESISRESRAATAVTLRCGPDGSGPLWIYGSMECGPDGSGPLWIYGSMECGPDGSGPLWIYGLPRPCRPLLLRVPYGRGPVSQSAIGNRQSPIEGPLPYGRGPDPKYRGRVAALSVAAARG
jgi:hypothetical protein